MFSLSFDFITSSALRSLLMPTKEIASRRLFSVFVLAFFFGFSPKAPAVEGSAEYAFWCSGAMAAKGVVKTNPDLKTRSSGILSAVSSLPGKHFVGDFGGGYAFVDWLQSAGQRWWQILGLNPADLSNSPFSSESGLAIDLAYLDLNDLVKLGLIDGEAVRRNEGGIPGKADFAKARQIRKEFVDAAYVKFKRESRSPLKREFREFRWKNGYWLTEHASFSVLKDAYGYDFTKWPAEYRDRKYFKMLLFRHGNRGKIERAEFEQFLLHRQWMKLRAYANSKGISVLGNMPLYTARYSANVWGNPEAFLLDAEKRPTRLSGYPPCNFYKTGQMWGTPVYDWDGLKRTKFRFWVNRFQRFSELFDSFVLDHFMGLHEYYGIDASEPTAENGKWYPAKGQELLERLVKRFGTALPVVAEDLGASVPKEVHEMRRKFGIPGMYILQFGYGPGADPYYDADKYDPMGVAYIGTHDNATLQEWLSGEWGGGGVTDSWEWIGKSLESRANLSITAIQDILELGADARMNVPGTWPGGSAADGMRRENWVYRWSSSDLTPALAAKLRTATDDSKRSAP